MPTDDGSAAVDAFLAGCMHPHKADIETLRLAILAVDPSISEGIKWKSPSFRTAQDYFATTHLRAKTGLGLILHRGAKPRPLPPGGLQIADPEGLLHWLAPDRAMLSFPSSAALQQAIPALQALLRQWIAQG